MIYLLLLVAAAFLIFPIFLGMLIRQQYAYDIYEMNDESVAIAWHLIEVNSEWIDKR